MKISTPEEHSLELRALLERQAALIRRQSDIARERAEIHAKVSVPPTDRHDRIAAMAAGIEYQPPPDDRAKLSALVDEDRDVKEALDVLAERKAELTRQVSREISAAIKPEYQKLASEFYSALCEVAAIHCRLGELRTAFARAGVEPFGITDFGRDYFGSGADRNNDLAIDLRKAAREGLIKASQIPGGYR